MFDQPAAWERLSLPSGSSKVKFEESRTADLCGQGPSAMEQPAPGDEAGKVREFP